MLWGQIVVTLDCIHLFDSVWAAPLYSPGACSPNKAGDWRYVPRGYSPLITHVCPPFRLSIVYVWMRIFPNYAPLVSNFPHSCGMKVFWRSPRPVEITDIKEQVLSLLDTDLTKWGSINVFPMLQDTKPLGHLSAVTPSLINPLNAELNPICHLLALLGAHHILHVSGLRVNHSSHSPPPPATSLHVATQLTNKFHVTDLGSSTQCAHKRTARRPF